MVDAGEVVSHSFGREDVVPILTVGEVVGREVCAGEDHLVVDSVELDVLKSPSLVDALGDQAFAETGQIGGVVHADLHSVGKVDDKRGKKGGTRGFWVLAGTT